MYVTRRDSYDPGLEALDLMVQPAHRIEVDGAPILKILRFDPGDETALAYARLRNGKLATLARDRLIGWALRDPERARAFQHVLADCPNVGEEATVERLCRIVPPDQQEGLAEFVRALAVKR